MNAYMFRYDLLTYVNIIQFTDIDSVASTTLAIQLDRHIEFRNTSSLFTVGYSHIPLETYHTSQMALANLGVFFENPLHWAALAAQIRRAVSVVAPIAAPYVKRAAIGVGKYLVDKATTKLKSMEQAQIVKKPPPKAQPRKRPVVVRRERRSRK
jgi:hypothetical protein